MKIRDPDKKARKPLNDGVLTSRSSPSRTSTGRRDHIIVATTTTAVLLEPRTQQGRPTTNSCCWKWVIS